MIRRPGADAARAPARRRRDRPTGTTCARALATHRRRDLPRLHRRPRRPRLRHAGAASSTRPTPTAAGRASSSRTPSRAGACRSRATRSTTRRCSTRSRSRELAPTARAPMPTTRGRASRPTRRRAGCSRAGAASCRRAAREPTTGVAGARRAARRGRRAHRREDVHAAGRSATRSRRWRACAAIGSRIVTASPDVSVSTNLGGWINRVGVFSPDEPPVHDEAPRLLQAGSPGPSGQHIELGISEMNLFMWLSQFGLTAELFGEPLIPIGTVYDPFIARGLDALIYALYIGSRFILVATPSGVTLAPGGWRAPVERHAVAGHRAAGPARLRAGVRPGGRVVPAGGGPRACVDRGADGFSTYLRLTTRPSTSRSRSPSGRASATTSGGARCSPAATGCWSRRGRREVGVGTARGRAGGHGRRGGRARPRGRRGGPAAASGRRSRRASSWSRPRTGCRPSSPGAAWRDPRPDRRVPAPPRHAVPGGHATRPIVTVLDGASHTLAFLGGAFGAPVVPLGVDRFGQSGTIGDLYAYAGIDTDHIVEAASSPRSWAASRADASRPGCRTLPARSSGRSSPSRRCASHGRTAPPGWRPRYPPATPGSTGRRAQTHLREGHQPVGERHPAGHLDPDRARMSASYVCMPDVRSAYPVTSSQVPATR